MARTPKYYHHGRSPAAWAGSILVAVGFTIAAVAAMLGPAWLWVIVGAAVIVVGALATAIMKAMGLGQP
ncbi:HGxxPAAW family protein [Tessaracoccus massiliensis]|uniref:HGxxPAAW family protein n=1 Tax=Tessaracoccus massiliensis TaxID=1522311 RepID=UPI00058C3E5A|nr:HGxxPAAW family protein [Tessaracoccus massiliensis]